MEDVSDFLLRLYTYARECGPDDFQGRVLDDLKCAFAFSCAFWCNGLVSTSGAGVNVTPNALHLHGLEFDFLARWSDVVPRDPMLPLLVANPGRVIRARVPSVYRALPEGADLARHHDIQSFRVISVPGLAPDEFQFLSLYQPRVDANWSDDQSRWMKRAMPHLAEAWRVHRALYPQGQADQRAVDSVHVAIADRTNGRLLQSDNGFRALLAHDWREFDGRLVPTPLRQAWAKLPSFRYLGNGSRYDGRCFGTVVHLAGRGRSRAEALTERQSQVAALYVQGFSYKEIARRCLISPATARNHIAAVYEMLGVHNKLALARLLGRSTMMLGDE